MISMKPSNQFIAILLVARFDIITHTAKCGLFTSASAQFKRELWHEVASVALSCEPPVQAINEDCWSRCCRKLA
jgi:hypothetical protein